MWMSMVVLGLFAFCYMLHSSVFVYMLGVTGSMSRHFDMSTQSIGWLRAAIGIGYLLAVPLLSYFGHKFRRFPTIGAGFLVVSASCLLLALTAAMIKPPTIEKNDESLSKAPFYPMSKEALNSPAGLISSFWFTQFPEDIQKSIIAYAKEVEAKELKAKSNGMQAPQTTTGPKRLENDTQASNATRFRRHQTELQKSIPSESIDQMVIRQKRQSKTFYFPDPISAQLKERIEMATAEFMFGGPYEPFIKSVYETTHSPDMFPRVVKAARLPFTYCRNVSLALREHIKQMTSERVTSTASTLTFLLAFIACLLMGVGTSVIWPYGLVLIDDVVSKRTLPLWYAAVTFFQMLGFGLGIFLGLLSDKKFYLNFSKIEGLTPIDPRWVGAWWFGLLLIGLAMAVGSAILLFVSISSGLHRVLNGNRTPPQERAGHGVLINGSHQNGDDKATANASTLKTQFQSAVDSLFDIARHNVCRFIILALTAQALSFKGYLDFMPTYLDNNFSFTGVPAYLPSGCYILGVAIGGVVATAYSYLPKLSLKKLAAVSLTASLLIFILSIITATFSCNSVVGQLIQVSNASIDKPINVKSPTSTWTSDYNLQIVAPSTYQRGALNFTGCDGCDCRSAEFFPVCAKVPVGVHQHTERFIQNVFFSPCHAGCTNFTYEIKGLNVEFYFNYCAAATNDKLKAKLVPVSRAACEHDCGWVRVFYIGFASTLSALSGITIIPCLIIILRSVQSHRRTFTIGIASFVICLLGLLISWPIYRLLTNSSCIYWAAPFNVVGKVGVSCEIYDPSSLRQRVHIFWCFCNFAALLFLTGAWYCIENNAVARGNTKGLVVESPTENETSIQSKDAILKDAAMIDKL